LAGLKERAEPVEPYEVLWNGRDELILETAGLKLKGARHTAGPRRRSLKSDDKAGAEMDAAGLVFPLTVRSRRPGDLYRPLGAPGRKKLKEILRAKGIPVAGRDRLPVILSDGEIVWVPGLPVGERHKITEATTSVISIRLGRAGKRRRSARAPKP
jgi:tRNA(Ile)-lysidine synthase